MFSSIPNGFFDIDNMEKLGEKYRKSTSNKIDPNDLLDSLSQDSETIIPNQNNPYEQSFNIDELRGAYPEANQEKQSIEISLTTGVAIITRLKIANGQYVTKVLKDRIDTKFIEEDVDKFKKVGFTSYQVKDSKILYLTKFNIL